MMLSDKDMGKRLAEAKKYEMLAIRALLPERAAGHLQVIEEEWKMLVTECVVDMVRCAAAGGMRRAGMGNNESADMEGTGNNKSADIEGTGNVETEDADAKNADTEDTDAGNLGNASAGNRNQGNRRSAAAGSTGRNGNRKIKKVTIE